MFLLQENLLNCVLLMPVGILLPVIAGHKVRWRTALMIGVLTSAVIETSQLVFMRGLFEWDEYNVERKIGFLIKFVREFKKKMLILADYGDVF